MNFDYSALIGLIVQVYGTRRKFAAAMGMTESSLSNKLTGVTEWKPSEIYKAKELLSISDEKFCAYFFTRKVA